MRSRKMDLLNESGFAFSKLMASFEGRFGPNTTLQLVSFLTLHRLPPFWNLRSFADTYNDRLMHQNLKEPRALCIGLVEACSLSTRNPNCLFEFRKPSFGIPELVHSQLHCRLH